jgi:centrosomal protein CEP135
MLTNERDKYIQMYEHSRDELQMARRDLVKNSKSQNLSLAAQSVLKRVENERDSALNDLKKLTNEKDAIKERLKVSYLMIFFVFYYFTLYKIYKFN